MTPLLAGGLALLGACRAGPVVVSSTPSTGTAAPAANAPAPRASDATLGWRIDAREHVDLWLHGFAMLLADSSLVPAMRLGYRDELSRERRVANAQTQLDANYLVLTRRFRENPALGSAQFVALYFGSWDDLRRGCQQFLRANGNVRAAGSQESLRMFATLATYFPSTADREWLRLFLESLDDERARFFRGWWPRQQSMRAATRATLEAQWRNTYAASFARFLRGTNQRYGALMLSLPLGGEGRSLDAGQQDNFVAVPFPAANDDPRVALFVAAHEMVGTVTNAVVRDNTTPADQQSGEAGRLSTLSAVRGGALLLERVAPDLAEPYRRYYLQVARQVPASDIAAQFDRIFPIPDPIKRAIERQIDMVLNGI